MHPRGNVTMKSFAGALFAVSIASGAAAKPAICYTIDGAKVIAQDGKFLGTIGGKYASNSIYGTYSGHGGKYDNASIWNKYSNYGDQYSDLSAFNKMAEKPPMVINNGNVIAYLSNNENLKGAINPVVLGIVYFDFEPDE
jgi:hypothetical protein